jgi:hypothetical protein
MKKPKIPEIKSPNPVQQAVGAEGTSSLSSMTASPMAAAFAPLSAGVLQRRAGRRSLLGG